MVAIRPPVPADPTSLPEGDGRTRRRRGDRLHGLVVESLESDILSGRLRIGDRLPSEAEIAATFDVSTRTVREALQILETRGLVQRRHGERAEVVRDDVGKFLDSLAVTLKQLFMGQPQYFVQLMDVRRIIELDVVDRLAGTGGEVSEEVERALAGMRAAAEADDFPRFTVHDAAFHLGLVHSVPNGILHVLYENLYALIVEVIRVASAVPQKPLAIGYAEHEEIYRLIRAGDAAAARQALARQIEGSAGYVRIALQARRPAAAGRRRTRSRGEGG
ncbi:FadR family transcriptional regulator [Rhodovastum atsumiense]|nr:GntR family transcriptional regulator [Rhodovastum atsumiense]CAH2604112.1 FadR family transcriptional regulator [Rhodovastum atsumiense]